ncbi:MAG: putative F420-dependent oxidoreductase [Acidimicrobiales bacterium]|jgi:probable F420-dependent oxidoreductase
MGIVDLELGAQLPAWQWDFDLSQLKDWAQGAEELGFEWLGMADHIFYAHPTDTRSVGSYAGGTIQHEIFTFLAWLAGQTEKPALTTSVLVLPQRQAPIVAKQAAEVDILSQGRFRLGIGIGWQEAEFEGLGKEFKTRGKRMEDDISVLRACWGAEPLNFDTPAEHADHLSMNPKPFTAGGPPILYGGESDIAVDRTARLCDGWIARTRFKPDDAAEFVSRLHPALEKYGKDPDTFPLQATVAASDDLDALSTQLQTFINAGVTRLGLHLPGIHDLDADPVSMNVDEHLEMLRRIREDVWASLI